MKKNLLLQSLVIFFLTFLGEMIAKLLPFPFPSSILGMFFLILLLFAKVIKEEHIAEKTKFIFTYMPIIFLPAAVNLLKYFDVLASIWWQFLLICFVSTAITFFVTAFLASVMVRFTVKKKKGE